MFYRVIIIKEDANRKSITVNAKSKAEVENMIPRIRELLFPGERPDEYRSVITEKEVEAYSPVTKVIEYQVTIYKLEEISEETDFEIEDIMAAESLGWYEETIEAENEEDARRKVIDKGCPYPDTEFEECFVYVNEIPVAKLLEEVEASILQRIENEYISIVAKDMTIWEFAIIQKNPEKRERLRYDALKFMRTAFMISSAFKKRKIDLTKMSAQEYIDYLTTLAQIEDCVAFEKTLKNFEEQTHVIIENRKITGADSYGL